MFLIVLMAILPMAFTDPVACKAGTFNRGETASVTCYFHKNVGKGLQHIYVSFRPFDARIEVEDTEVFVCFRKYIDTLVCNNSSGYNSDNVISSNLTLEIPDVQARFAGRYTCQLVPHGGQQSESCDLHVEGHPLSPGTGQSQCGVSPPPHDEEEKEEEEKEEEDEEKVEQEECIAILLFAAIFLTTIYLIYTTGRTLQRMRRTLQRMRRTLQLSDEDNECANVTSSTKELEMLKEDNEYSAFARPRYMPARQHVVVAGGGVAKIRRTPRVRYLPAKQDVVQYILARQEEEAESKYMSITEELEMLKKSLKEAESRHLESQDEEKGVEQETGANVPGEGEAQNLSAAEREAVNPPAAEMVRALPSSYSVSQSRSGLRTQLPDG